MALALMWLGFAFAVGIFAGRRDRNGLGWFLLAAVISPLFAGVLLLVVGEGRSARCPFCAERIKQAATICPHCRTSLVAASPKSAAPITPDEDTALSRLEGLKLRKLE